MRRVHGARFPAVLASSPGAARPPAAASVAPLRIRLFHVKELLSQPCRRHKVVAAAAAAGRVGFVSCVGAALAPRLAAPHCMGSFPPSPVTRIDRRAFLASAGGSLAAAWLAADVAQLLAAGEHAAAAGRQRPLPAFEYLSPNDAADLEAATSQIIPSDDTPGAREARVVYFIDHGLATWQKEQREAFRKGITELRKRARAHGAATFAALTDAQQQGVIAALDTENHEFFFALRGATIVGMLSHPDYHGNFEKSGWKMIGFVDRFSWAPPFGWYDANAR